MAINKKLVHFKTFAKFNEELSAGNILDTSICWIKDTKQIWTHGQFYDCSSLTDEDIVGTALVGYTESVETNENLDLTAEDTIVGAFGKLVKAIKDNKEVDSAAFVKLRDSVGLDENLGFSTSAGDANVTEAIERIDGKIISTGDGTKFLADNGQYLVAGRAVDITDIFNRLVNLPQPEPQCTDEDYNALKEYALNGVVTYINDNNDTGAVIHIKYLSGTITIEAESSEDDRRSVLTITIEPNKLVNMESYYIPYVTGVGKGYLGSYTKPSAYSAITKDDSISKAIGKLEANVEKITTSGDGAKFLADNGEYKEIKNDPLIINVNSLNEYLENTPLSGVTYNDILSAIDSGRKILIHDLSSPTDYHYPISITKAEGIITLVIDIQINTSEGLMPMYDATVIVAITDTNAYGVIKFNKSVLTSNGKDIDLSVNYKIGGDSENISTRISLKKSGDGTKFLSDDGQYKKIGTPIEAVGSNGAITQELSPNTYYKFGRCTSLTIALGTEVPGILNEYMFEFLSGVTPTVLNLPQTVKWNNGNTPIIEANKKYIVSIVSNIAVIVRNY